MAKEKRAQGRPPLYPLPEPIDVSSEEIAQVVLPAKLKKDWRFEQEAKAQGLKPRRRR